MSLIAVPPITENGHHFTTPTTNIGIVLVDDASLFRDGMANLLAAQKDFRIFGAADTPGAAVELIRSTRPDVILLGWPAGSAASQRIFAAIQDSKPVARIIVLSDEESKDDFLEAIKQGCCGVVPKQTSTELLLKSIRKVHAGEFWLDRITTAEVIRRLARKGQCDECTFSASRSARSEHRVEHART